jgi:5-methylcytosine-specific restriction endonuclease McrA
MTSRDLLSTLSNEALLAETVRLAARERAATAELIEALAEVDARRLYLGEGCSSMYAYCTRVLRLSEHAAYGRIEAARAARRFPVVLELLADGSLTLTSVGLLARSLTEENHRDVLGAARHKTTREVEHHAAALRPKPDVPASVRKLPKPKSTELTAAAALLEAAAPDISPDDATGIAFPIARMPSPPSAAVKPLAPERYRVQFTVGSETHEKLRRAQDLLRHAIPNGDPAAIFDRALTLLIEQLEKKKLAAARRPRGDRATASQSRHVPASVRRIVWKRDGGRCAFLGAQGRCEERGFLELHHVRPYAAGGPATVENLELRCKLCRYRHKRHYADWRIMPHSRGRSRRGADCTGCYAA